MKAGKLTALLVMAFGIVVVGSLTSSIKTFAASQDSCVSVTSAADLGVWYTADDALIVHTVNGLPVCGDVNVNYSTYVLPSSYDGNGFYYANSNVTNPTAYPQSLLTNRTITVIAGTDSTFVDNLPAIDACVNTQTDLYIGPEIMGINAQGYGFHADGSFVYGSQDVDHTFPIPGHGTQLIDARLYGATGTNCEAAPGMGGGDGATTTTTPPETTTTSTQSSPAEPTSAPKTTVSATPTVLPDTGVNTLQNMAGALTTLMSTAGMLFAAGIRTLRR